MFRRGQGGNSTIVALKRLRNSVRSVVTVSSALWLWRHRVEVQRWWRYLRALPSRRGVSRSDLFLEARVRAAMSSDPRLAGKRGVEVDGVTDGVAVLAGRPDDVLTRIATEVAANVKGVREVRVQHPVPIVVSA
jgi:osmotically-inducible protein OsmY